MESRKAIERILQLAGGQPLIACNGFVSRELYALRDAPNHFYMIGSMGLASSIALGVALSRPDRKVIVLDGDGNVQMGLSVFPMVSATRPANLIHIVFDNGVHNSTGGQRTAARLEKLGEAASRLGYENTRRAETELEFEIALEQALAGGPSEQMPEGPGTVLRTQASRGCGPWLIHAITEPITGAGLPRVEIPPPQMVRRFREFLDS